MVGPIGTIQTVVPGGDPSYRKQGTAAGGSGVRRARVEDLGPGVQVNLEKEVREQGQEADRRLRLEIRYRLGWVLSGEQDREAVKVLLSF